MLINLLKNAEEAGAVREAVTLDIEATSDGGTKFVVMDRGQGMTPEVLKNALVPFFSTKERGSGIGLALCREIVGAHDGKLHIEPRDGGGTAVTCWLPGRHTVLVPTAARLTLTRS